VCYDETTPSKLVQRELRQQALELSQWMARGWVDPVLVRPFDSLSGPEKLRRLALDRAREASKVAVCEHCSKVNPLGTAFCNFCYQWTRPVGLTPLQEAQLGSTPTAARLEVWRRPPLREGQRKRTIDKDEERWMKRAQKRAVFFGFPTAAHRVLHDPVYAHRMSTRSKVTKGGPSAKTILMGAVALLTGVQPADAQDAVESSLRAVVVFTHGADVTNSSYMLAAVLLACFLFGWCCGLSARGVARGVKRFVLGGLRAAYKGAQWRRSIGVQSQCTYLRDREIPRFAAFENGFRDAGAMSVGLPFQV